MQNGWMTRRWLALGLILILSGCAKLPDGGLGVGSTRLIFKMTMEREINPNFVYMVALRPSNESNPPEIGPIPVVAEPWGNGFVSGDVSHFVQWSRFLSPKYQLFQFREGTDLIEYRAIGVPISYVDVATGDNMIQFELNLDQLADVPADALNFQSLQVNFLTMDVIPQGTGGSKNWDALGNGLLTNSPVTVPLRISGTYNNQSGQFFEIEPAGDVADPDLDIVEWSIEVRRS